VISFEGKVAIVTGAAQGIGAGIVSSLAGLGAHVGLIDVDAGRVDETANRLERSGHTVAPYAGDVRDRDFVQRVVAKVSARWGAVDILVNNAGIIRDNLVENISEEDWDAVVGVNLKGTFLCSQAVVSIMKERRYGKIVNIISRSWLGNIGQANYSASKGGLVSLTRTLALELARHNITVNGVSPGLVDTPMTQKLPDKVRDRLVRAQPTGAMGTVDDIANAVCFLASDRSQFVTGQILHVDGGKSCRSVPPI
jgi:NAD(P)-dependent dehydrogenase (short-subunit alcohol dehydrogenase family)